MKRLDPAAELSVLAPATLSFSEPQPDWLPWHIARLCFLPRFADPSKDFASKLQSLAQQLSKIALSFDVSSPGMCVITHGKASLTVSCYIGEFSIEVIREANDDGGGIHIPFDDDEDLMGSPLVGGNYFSGLPEEFFGRCERRDFKFLPVHRNDCELLLGLAHELWSSMRRGLSLALRNGSAKVFGRWRSIGEEFKPVYLDQLLELGEPEVTVIDEHPLSEFDVRTAINGRDPSGVSVFSLQIAFKQLSASEQAEDDAAVALVQLMKGGSPGKKDDVKADIMKRFNLHSVDSFNRVWRSASRIAKYVPKKGRPRKTAQ